MLNIELDEEFLKLFYNITNSNPPKEINLSELKKQLAVIKNTFSELNSKVQKATVTKLSPSLEEIDNNEENKGPAILIVDDLGVITYQLKVLLSQFEYDVESSQEIYDAVNKYKMRKYKYVVMDLFIPTEREGFILLTELKKMALASGSDITIGVITASPRKEIENQCMARGADFFLEKNNNWQNALVEIMKKYIDADKDEEKEEEEEY